MKHININELGVGSPTNNDNFNYNYNNNNNNNNKKKKKKKKNNNNNNNNNNHNDDNDNDNDDDNNLVHLSSWNKYISFIDIWQKRLNQTQMWTVWQFEQLIWTALWKKTTLLRSPKPSKDSPCLETSYQLVIWKGSLSKP